MKGSWVGYSPLTFIFLWIVRMTIVFRVEGGTTSKARNSLKRNIIHCKVHKPRLEHGFVSDDVYTEGVYADEIFEIIKNRSYIFSHDHGQPVFSSLFGLRALLNERALEIAMAYAGRDRRKIYIMETAKRAMEVFRKEVK